MRVVVVLILLLSGLTIYAQKEEERQKIIEQRIEFIGENLEDSDLDLTTFFDELYFFLDNPINLNATHFAELSQLRILTDVQMQAILNYRRLYGEFVTIYELGAIEELDPQVIEMIVPFVTISEVKEDDYKWRDVFKRGKHEFIMRYDRVLEEKAGYADVPDSILEINPNKKYLGSPDHVYFRYRTQYRDRISWGITAEKDAGEQFFNGTQKQGFDYYSAHLFFKDLWKFKKLAIGDYQMSVGQGLTMWSGFQMGKSANVMGAKRSGSGLRPYTSVNESRFLRGAGFTVGSDHIEFSAFGSYKGLDANINQVDTTSDDPFFDNTFSSFQISGYHRLQSEIDDKNAVKEMIGGAELAYSGDKMRIGLASVYTRYDQNLVPYESAYKQYKFAANQLLTSGINYRYYSGKLSLFGETSMSDNTKVGTVNGVAWHIDPRVDLLVIHRYYDKGFQSLYSAGFGESSDNTGENGLYFGATARLSKHINFSAYYDQFNYTFLKYLTDDYSVGREVFLQTDIKFNWRSKMYIRFRNKITERDTKDDVAGIDNQVQLNKTNLRLHYEQRINSQLVLRSRIEWVKFMYDKQRSDGLLLFQDVVYEFKKIPLKVYGRYAIFDTDNYDSRVYAYENDLLYVFSIPSYYYRGMRTYLMLKYEIGRWADIWLRWGLWSYENRDVISSGLEEIDGSRKSDIKIQLKIRL